MSRPDDNLIAWLGRAATFAVLAAVGIGVTIVSLGLRGRRAPLAA